MEVRCIEFLGNDGWEKYINFKHTPSEQLHIPRIGDTIQNNNGKYYTVTKVVWILESDYIMVYCDLVTEN